MVKPKRIKGIGYLSIAGIGNQSKALLFLPGTGAFKENYVTFLEEFRSVYGQIFVLDLPEQGSKGAWLFGQMSANLDEFINLKIDDTVHHIDLMGHSAGALAVLSHLTHYNILAEEGVSKLIQQKKMDKENLGHALSMAKFCELRNEQKKIKKVVLFSPPDSLGVAFPKFWAKILASLNTFVIRVFLNVFINFPLKVMGWFLSKSQTRPSFKKSKKPQFFALTFSDHHRFFNYIAHYKTIFELFHYLDNHFQDKLKSALQDKELCIQYGSMDWVLKPTFRINELENNYLIDDSIVIYCHQGLGHLLKKRRSLDLNLYDQLLINRKVVEKTRQFLTNQNHGTRN
ncbi:alpha/beta fold hydrolase [Reichenbachiella sp.]|uniref:alpha/beta fold hydrolase n=1 Tax=Reichenbachiella sp. TaxID=2184521 RepID=UPI003B5A58AA